MVAVLGAAALALATHARAEGGEGSSIVSPQEIESVQAPAAAETAQAEGAAEAAPSEKAAKSALKKGAKPAALAAASELPDAEGGESDVASSAPSTVKVGIRLSDAARAGALKPLIARYTSENSLPFELADAVVRLESRYNARARNGGNLGLNPG